MRALFIIAAIFLLYQLVFRYLLPYYVGKTIRKTQERMYQNFNEGQQKQKKEGEVHIDVAPNTKQSKRDPGGEYVDYVEIK
ncbi:MAG: hypothetical protein ACK4GL_08095 [Flavobacteriales bacterium]